MLHPSQLPGMQGGEIDDRLDELASPPCDKCRRFI
jgi:hypothetical protein